MAEPVTAPAPRLSMLGIRKTFGATVALIPGQPWTRGAPAWQ
jgi:hypothetical protein